MESHDKYLEEAEEILKKVEDEEKNSRSFSFYFSRAALNTLLWLDCSVSNESPGGLYWDGKNYFVPISVNDYRINGSALDEENFKVKEGLSSGMNVLDIADSVKDIKEIVLYENLNFNKDSHFEVLVNFLTRKNDRGYISLSRNQLDSIILKK